MMRHPLTATQVKTLRLLASGYTSKEAAKELGISPNTMKDRMTAIRHKLGAFTTAHAVVAAHKSGVLQ